MSTKKTSLPSAFLGLLRLLARFRPELRRQAPLLGLACLAMLLEVAFRLLEPWPLGLLFDALLDPAGESLGRIGEWLRELEPTEVLIVLAAAVVAIAGLRALCSYLKTVWMAVAGNRFLTEVRHQLFSHLQKLSLTYHARSRAGDLVSRVVGDVGRLQEVALTALLPLVANVLTLTGMVLFMLTLNVKLTLISLAIAPVFLVSLKRRAGEIRNAARQQRQREGNMASQATESLSAIESVQALSLEGVLEGAFAAQSRAGLKEGVRTRRLAAGLERRVDVMIAIGTALVLWFGARAVLDQEMTSGNLLIFLGYLKSGFRPLRDLAKYSGRVAKAYAAAERIIDVLEEEPEIQDAPQAIEAKAFRGEIRFEGVSYGYDPARPVLRNLDLTIRPGEKIAVVGPSGAGKSTLVSLVLRLADPTQGTLRIDGQDLRTLRLESVRRQMATVLQETALFAVSARENIGFGHPDATDEAIRSAAREARASEFLEKLPDGFDTVLGERGTTLSGGERQRIAIARAFVRDAPILLLDEPTTGLDRRNQAAVLEALSRLMQGRTTLMVAHDLGTVTSADRILYLEHGEIVERGTHEQLLAMNGRYARLYARQRAEIEGRSSSPCEVPHG